MGTIDIAPFGSRIANCTACSATKVTLMPHANGLGNGPCECRRRARSLATGCDLDVEYIGTVQKLDSVDGFTADLSDRSDEEQASIAPSGSASVGLGADAVRRTWRMPAQS